jgi:hypothetical protein
LNINVNRAQFNDAMVWALSEDTSTISQLRTTLRLQQWKCWPHTQQLARARRGKNWLRTDRWGQNGLTLRLETNQNQIWSIINTRHHRVGEKRGRRQHTMDV